MFMFFIMLVILFIAMAASVAKRNKQYEKEAQIEKQQREEEARKVYAQMEYETQRFHEFYSAPINRMHYENIEKIEIMYKMIYHANAYFSNKADELIELCKKDIAIAPDFIKHYQKYNQELPDSYGTYNRLAYMYEKRQEYDKAAQVCCEAIKTGFVEDGTTGKMYARLVRMIKKANYDTVPQEYLALIPDETP